MVVILGNVGNTPCWRLQDIQWNGEVHGNHEFVQGAIGTRSFISARQDSTEGTTYGPRA